LFGGEWIESPFQAQGPTHFISESRPGYLHIGCIEKSYEGWIVDGYRTAKKFDAERNNEYVKYESYIEPIILKYLDYSEKNWDDLSLIQKGTYKIVKSKAEKYLANKKNDKFKRD